ncbi:RecF/RecN/SMC protein [Coprinellus micaceus]|uniref:RecF/RecN/SMC protein n=1 Tax=Coprinellus micaceus TaxID=71717 RepID=A0A4Y7T963_COPMI|nr:RecF/RecN/SMC protein [Coprinellus micaceus]
MYIKTLTIQGFKSYRDQTQIEPFSSKHNVVVGRNGSGKSNFFAAIRFVLSDAYTSMSREERVSLLHEGVSDAATLSAFVEIVFDNSDNRFPTGHEEVVLRRTIGLKKDEYSLDRKSASKADVMNLLESAGFSKSNPYYIVPQGRITALTNAKDHERLALLKEVAEQESLRIMAETDSKRSKISELLEYIESRLAELEEEKEELKEFQEKDKERRCLEYALYQRELEDVAEALLHGANIRREKFSEREKEIQDLERKIQEAKHAQETLAQTKQDAQAELTDFVRSRTEIECIIEDLKAAGLSAGGKRQELEEELEQIQERIAEKEESLAEVLPEWENWKGKEAVEKRRLDEASARLATKGERDNFLRHEIESMKAYKATQASALENSRSELDSLRGSESEIQEQIQGVQENIDDGRKKVKDLGDQVTELKEKYKDLTEKRKDLWREDTKLDSLVSRASEELRSAERGLAGMMDKDTGQGLRAVDSIAERYKLAGVYGPLYRLFEVSDPKFNTAVEQTGWQTAFTFMPLNRLKPKNPTMPNGQDAEPLLNKLNYDPKFEKAFSQVFGKTCVCRDLNIAAAYVKSHGINTITLDGDKVDRKGALTGRSRIEGIKNVTAWRAKFEAESTRSKQVKDEITQVEQEITQMNGRIVRESGLMDEGGSLSRAKERAKERIERLEADVEELETELAGLDSKVQALTAELKTPLSHGITAEEERLIVTLGKEVEQRKKEMVELSRKKNELEAKKNALEIELKERLHKRQEDIQSRLDALGEGDDDASEDDLEARNRELRSLNNSIQSLTKKVQGMDKESEGLTSQVQDLRATLERVQSQQAEDGRSMSKQQKTTERYLAKRQMLTAKKDECNRNIRDLGVLPEEAFEKYINERVERLMKKLHAKAFEQYSNFTKQRDTLINRREELDTSAQSIEELVQVLDQRKDEAIERTFKQVAKNFEEVFEKLVPAGRGRLIIQRRIDQDAEEDEETQKSSIDNYTGISIKVSFNSKVDEGLRIQQLSGGQKSLVALATVFAIQKCDPAPFYLFDEIDANLDAQYRTAVASMIQELSSTAQFIVTTFRPEMLVTADKFYGVLFNNQKVSSIRSIKREEAQEFVDQEALAQ